MTAEPLNIVVFQEEGAWVAHCVEVDICAQGPDLPTLRRRMDLTIRFEMEESIRRNGHAFQGIGPAPESIRARWRATQKDFVSSGTAQTEKGQS